MINFCKNLHKIIPKKNYLRIFFVLVGNQLSAILEIAGLGLIPIIAFYLINPERIVSILENKNIYFLNDLVFSENFIFISLFLLVFFFISKNLLNIFFGYYATKVKVDIFKEISLNFFNDFIKANYDYFLNKDSSFVYSLFNNEIKATSEIVELTINFIRDIFVIIIITTLLFFIDFQITFSLIIIFTVLIFIINKIIKNFSLKQGKISLEQRLSNVKLLNQTFDLIRDAKILKKENFFSKLFERQIFLIGKHKVYNNLLNLFPKPILEIFIIITIVLIILYFNYLENIQESVVLISFLGISSVKLIPALKSLSNVYNGINFNLNSFNLVISEINKMEKTKDLQNKSDLFLKFKKINFLKKIVINNLFFSYNRKDFSIENWNFQIKKNEKFGIIGESGSGKTSFVNILLGLIKPSDGKILVDDKNLFDNIPGWYDLISFVPQDIYIINDTIKKNIAIGLDENNIDHNHINKILKIVNLDEFISSLPKGIDTILGSRGLNISGGQRQRIGIARALYKKPSILILDEATSALDAKNQEFIINQLIKIEDLTLIMVSHQLNLLKNFDKIVLVENGKIKDYENSKI